MCARAHTSELLPPHSKVSMRTETRRRQREVWAFSIEANVASHSNMRGKRSRFIAESSALSQLQRARDGQSEQLRNLRRRVKLPRG